MRISIFNTPGLGLRWHTSHTHKLEVLMSGKVLQLSPQSSTGIARTRIALHDSQSAPSPTSPDKGFLPTWFQSESRSGSHRSGGINWGAIAGLVLSVVISGSVWAGVAWMVMRVWR